MYLMILMILITSLTVVYFLILTCTWLDDYKICYFDVNWIMNLSFMMRPHLATNINDDHVIIFVSRLLEVRFTRVGVLTDLVSFTHITIFFNCINKM